MQRGVRADLRSGRHKSMVNRSKSKSRSPSPKKHPNQKNQKKLPKTSNDKNKRNRSPSIGRSQSKKKLNKSSSNRKVGRSSSLPRHGGNNKKPPINNNKKQIKNRSRSRSRSPSPKNNKNLLHSPKHNPLAKKDILEPKKHESTIPQQEKDMGLIYHQPEHEKIILKTIDALDDSYEKFLEMVSNDNDTSYVMNALPEFRDLKKDDDSSGRDFISGKITRLSGVFDNLTVDKITGPLKKVPIYYQGQCGKHLTTLKISLLTKFKVSVDLGFLQYSLDGEKITIFRIYISKIYRRMNYIAFTYLQVLKGLMQKHPAADRWSIFILQRNFNVHKFFKFLGLKIEKIITESKPKHQVDYYQEFIAKKKELQTAVSAFK